MHPFRLGLAAPVFASPGIVTMRTPTLEAASWTMVRDAVLRAEQLGYDSAWFSDHLFHGRDGAFFESWTALSMAAGFTDRIRLVNNHLGNGLRDARVMAKAATTLSAATDGRLDLFLASGYREREYRSYGLPFESDAVRTRKLGEAVDVFRALWPGDTIDFDGEFYQLRGARATPTGTQPPFVWLGGPTDDDMLALVAQKADGWNTFPLTIDAYRAASDALDEQCRRIGRDPAALRRSLETQVLVLEDWSQWQGWLDRWRRMRQLKPPDDATSDITPTDAELDDERITDLCREQFLVGTRSEITGRIAEYRRLGVTDLVCWFINAPSDSSMRALSEIRASLPK